MTDHGWPDPPPGATRALDRFRWLDIVQSEHGPADAPTRHALLTMGLRMDPDGSRCTLGVRGLAARMSVNKDTAAKHRDRAVAEGWLRPPARSKFSRVAEWLPTVPANLAYLLALSEAVGQSKGNGTVIDCPKPSDSETSKEKSDCPEKPAGCPEMVAPLSEAVGHTTLTTITTPNARAREGAAEGAPRSRAHTESPERPTDAPVTADTPQENGPMPNGKTRPATHDDLLKLAPALGLAQHPNEQEDVFLRRVKAVNDQRLARLREQLADRPTEPGK